jgi:hypothetical protein
MINPTTTQYRSAVRVQILIGLIAALTIGCQTVQFKSRLIEKNKSEGTQYKKSAAELRIYLDELTGIFSGTIEQAADHVITASPANEIKRHALLWKINGIPAAYGALFQPDPAIAIIDTWAFSMQMVDYFERGPGKADFGLWLPIANEASLKLETRIREMVASGMPNGDTDPLQQKIQTWVLAHPIERDFLYRDTVAPQLASIIGDQAMDAMQTVGTLAIGVEDLADRFTAQMNLLTKQARWQAELVVAETAGRTDMEGKLAMLAGVADSVNRLLPIAEQSATLIAREREAFFEDLRQERIDVLSNIERQRLETISFVIGERATIVDDLTSERTTILDTLQSERESILQSIDAQRVATLTELESIGNRMGGMARRQTEQLIDHVFIRMLQLIAISLLCTVVLVVLLSRLKGKTKRGAISGD